MTIEDTEGLLGKINEEDMVEEEVEEVAEVGEEEVDIIRDMIRRDIEVGIGIIKKVAIMRREGKEDIRRINHFRKFSYFLF